MQIDDFSRHPTADANRPLIASILRGAKSKCPSCGTGAIYDRLLSVRDRCPDCAAELHHHRADDLPAYLNILLVGHVVVGVMMVLLSWELLPLWGFAAVTAGLAVACGIALMRPIKGAVIGAQWALRMHGFGDHDG